MKKVALFFGGMGNEAEVSVTSARNIVKNFDLKKFKLVLIFWGKDGLFYEVKDIKDLGDKKSLTVIPASSFRKLFDVAFLITHGKYGEDGVLQAILESVQLPYAGCRVLSSALCMDKAMLKIFLQDKGIPQVAFEILDSGIIKKNLFQNTVKKAVKKIGFPAYVKPANSGSSVGISKVRGWKDLNAAVQLALLHDKKIVIERGLESPREIEVGVLGNDELIISPLGELLLTKDFYSYEDKYKSNDTGYCIPAKLSKKDKQRIAELAEKVYRLCDCRGFSRLDFFISDNKVYFNEINTLPGFTEISMFPMLMKASGISFKSLITRIVNLAS